MNILDALKKRRSYYNIGKDLPVAEEKVEEIVKEAFKFTPSAFNSQTAKGVLLFGEKHDKLWDIVFNTLKPMVSEEQLPVTKAKIQGFKDGAGTILFFEDENAVKELQKQFPSYSDNFVTWSQQGNGMVQIISWSALREENIGASLQHYNPIIDEEVKETFGIPDGWKLMAQMPFGNILEEPEEKEKVEIEKRVKIYR